MILPLPVRGTRGMNSVQERDGDCLVFINFLARFYDFFFRSLTRTSGITCESCLPLYWSVYVDRVAEIINNFYTIL
jgi:hypothetical protein